MEWGGVCVTERGVAAVDDGFEVGGWDLGGGDVEGEDLVCQVGEGEVFPCGLPVGGELWDLFWDEEAAI